MKEKTPLVHSQCIKPLTEEEIKNMKTFSEKYSDEYHPYDPINYFAAYPERKLDPEQKYFESLDYVSIWCYGNKLYEYLHSTLIDKFPELSNWGHKDCLSEYIDNNKEKMIKIIKKQIKDLQSNSNEQTTQSSAGYVTVSSNKAAVEPKRIKITLEELNSRIGKIKRPETFSFAHYRGSYHDLELVFDYDKLNELGQSIMLIEKNELIESIFSPKIIEKDERLKQLLSNRYMDCSGGCITDCNIILYSLMILCVDTTEFNKKLSIICDLAQSFDIDEESIQEIIRIVQNVYKMDNQIGSKLDERILKNGSGNFKIRRQRYLYELYNDIDFRINN